VVANEHWRYEAALACCAAVSSSRGVVHWETRQRSFTATDIIDFLTSLSNKIQNPTKCIILLDNATIHTCNRTRLHAEALGLTLVFNVPYAPWYNGIENVWAQIKKNFSCQVLKIKTNTMAAKPLSEVVNDAMNSVRLTTIVNCCMRAERLILLDAESG